MLRTLVAREHVSCIILFIIIICDVFNLFCDNFFRLDDEWVPETANQEYYKDILIQNMTSFQKCQVEKILRAAYCLPFDPSLFSWQNQRKQRKRIKTEHMEENEDSEQNGDTNNLSITAEERDDVDGNESKYGSVEKDDKDENMSIQDKLLYHLKRQETRRERNLRKRRKNVFSV